MGNIEIKEEAIITQKECDLCDGLGYLKPKFQRKHSSDSTLSPLQKMQRDQCIQCLGKGSLTIEQHEEKNFQL